MTQPTPSSDAQEHPPSCPVERGYDAAAFGFPYAQAYPQQLELMREVYRTLEDGAVGMFESPTGTGKSLSLICGALTWLRDRQAREQSRLVRHPDPIHDDDPEWLRDAVPVHMVRRAAAAEAGGEVSPDNAGRMQAKRPRAHHRVPDEDPEMRFLLQDPEEEGVLESDTCATPSPRRNGRHAWNDMQQSCYATDSPQRPLSVSPSRTLSTPLPAHRILFGTRTHSQIAQFFSELKRTRFSQAPQRVPAVAVASRKLMCIHPEVRALPSAAAVNDRCMELTEGQRMGDGDGGCPYYRRTALDEFVSRVHAEVRDIEDLVQLGQELRACPYFGARRALPHAELIAMPYQTLLHRGTRESLGIEVNRQCAVVLDEAHNLADAMNAVYSVVLTRRDLHLSEDALRLYEQRFASVLRPDNLFYLRQLRQFVTALVRLVNMSRDAKAQNHSPRGTAARASDAEVDAESGGPDEMCLNPHEAVFAVELDNLNMQQLAAFVRDSLLARRITGYLEHVRRRENEAQNAAANAETDGVAMHTERMGRASSPFYALEAMLNALCNPDEDGRVIIRPRTSVKYALLNPSVPFSEMAQTARAVVLAGGTMEPRAVLLQQLMTEEVQQRVHFRVFPHVVPREQVLALAVDRGPTRVKLDFSYAQQHNVQVLDELGRCLRNVATIVPAGVIVFYPSYRLMERVWRRLRESGAADDIDRRKQLFFETRGMHGEQLLAEYAEAVREARSVPAPERRNGALLNAVVGGRLSEGINFADDLGRCVIMVGLPFPNVRDALTREHMFFIERQQSPKRQSAMDGGTQPVQRNEYLQDRCMIAVNQSVGRVIRHAHDYAAILFMDVRYVEQGTLRAKLSRWLRDYLSDEHLSFGSAHARIAQFYRRFT
eukprot:ctg_603.g272